MAQQIKDPGIGTRFSKKTKRLINSDGSYNIRRKGTTTGIRDIFKALIELSWSKFFGFLFLGYILMNLVFTGVYLLCGIENLNGLNPESGNLFLNTFFFSVQTFTTVGYGGITPVGISTNVVATVEAFVGFLSFSLATGLLYARFSRPNSKLIFSDKALFSKHLEGQSIKIKFANQRDNVLLEVKAKVILTFDKHLDSGEIAKEYFILPLELDEVELLPFTWTLVHKIDDESPLSKMTEEEIKAKNPEFLVLIKGFDEIYSQHIRSKYSYGIHEMEWNKNFVKSYKAGKDGMIDMDLSNINLIEDD